MMTGMSDQATMAWTNRRKSTPMRSVGAKTAAGSSAIRHLGLTRTESAATFQYGSIELDMQAHQVQVSGEEIHLAPREFALVRYLLAEAPRVVSAKEIAAILGDDNKVISPVRVRKYVQNLRRKLGQTRPGQPAVLETVRGLGYRMVDNKDPNENT